jgi:hypothetical protein
MIGTTMTTTWNKKAFWMAATGSVTNTMKHDALDKLLPQRSNDGSGTLRAIQRLRRRRRHRIAFVS